MQKYLLAAGIAALATGFGGAAYAQTPAPTQLSIGTKFVQNYCMEVRSSDGTVVINKCSAEAPQAINYDENTGQILQGDKCIAGPIKGQPLTLRACTSQGDELWTFEANGSLKTDAGLCADVLNFGRDPGTAVITWDCTGANNQEFFLTNIRKAAPSAAPAEAALEPVKGTPAIASYFTQGKCLAANGKGEMVIEPCNRGPEQSLNFAADNSGAIVQGGKCLSSATKGEALVLVACSKKLEQDWAFTEDGTLKNRAGLCADILRFDPTRGTPVIAWDCTATDNQKFYPALAAKSGAFTMGPKLAEALRSAKGVTTLSILPGYSPYNMTGSGGGKLAADEQNRVTSTEADTVVLGGAGVLTVRFVNGLANDSIKAQEGKVSLLPTDWSFFSGTTAGTMKLK